MKQKIIDIAMQNNADIVRFADSKRFPADDAIFKIMPEVKTVIGLGFRILRGAYRGVEEGSTYYQYSTMAVENMEETVMPMALLLTSVFIEENGFTACPQKFHQQIMAEDEGTNPETRYFAIYHGVKAETQMDFPAAAVLCGLGEKGMHGTVLNDEFGPMMRYCFILTDAEIEPDEMVVPHLCDKCKECIKACPGGAIDENGNIDPWQCAVYYKGAKGTINPFMPPDAFSEFDDRLDIIAGKARVTPEKAKKILDELECYPSVCHSYSSSICGKKCDVACYIHLEKKGLLKRKMNTCFRKRPEWKFDIKDFE